MPLLRGIYSPETRFNIGRSKFRESVEIELPAPNVGAGEAGFKLTIRGKVSASTRATYRNKLGIDIESINTLLQTDEEKDALVKEGFRALADELCKAHPAISTDPAIFGGVPHIKGVRLTVGDILAKLYTYGNTQEILATYSPHVSEEQIKEAIAYAQDFLEMACDPDEPSEADD